MVKERELILIFEQDNKDQESMMVASCYRGTCFLKISMNSTTDFQYRKTKINAI